MNIYCFSTLSFAKLQFKSVINKVFHKHGVASFTDAWIETYGKLLCQDSWCSSHLLQMRGLKQNQLYKHYHPHQSHLLQMRGLKLVRSNSLIAVRRSHLLQMRGLKLRSISLNIFCLRSHLLQMRGLKRF